MNPYGKSEWTSDEPEGEERIEEASRRNLLSERASLEQLHEWVNRVRSVGGEDLLDALLPSVPADGSACLIARNFNFSCEITPETGELSHRDVDWADYDYEDWETNWVVSIPNIKKGVAVAESLGILGSDMSLQEPTFDDEEIDQELADAEVDAEEINNSPYKDKYEYFKDEWSYDNVDVYGRVIFPLSAPFARLAEAFDLSSEVIDYDEELTKLNSEA